MRKPKELVLEDKDKASRHSDDKKEKQPDKKVYALTEAGRRELRDWLAKASTHDPDARNESFLKIMLARQLPWADPLAVVAVERREAFRQLHAKTAARAEAERKKMGAPRLLVLELAVLRLEAFLKWLDRCEETLSREAKR